MSMTTEAPVAPGQAGGRSFCLRYLGRELGRRARQATVIGLGLALGIGLVITVSAAAGGVKNAQASVLHSLYGVGTDITVTQAPASGSAVQGPNGKGAGRISIQGGPGRNPTVCINGKCNSGPQSLDNLISGRNGTISYGNISKVAGLNHVKAAAGGLTLTDNRVTISSTSFTPPTQFSVQGVDLAHENLGPLSSGRLSAGRNLQTTDTSSDVALVDADYATANKLSVGSDITIAKHTFKLIGIVTQPQASNPPDVYIPLAVAQTLGTQGPGGSSLKGYVNTIYVTADSTADIGTVQREIKALLPHATVTTPSSLASEINGSLGSAAKLAGDLGTWLSILVLVAAFAVAGLLTMSAVSRRAREFGTLKAIGWRSRRIIGQVMGESLAIGLIGGAVGIGLGVGGVAIIDAIAPNLTATIVSDTGLRFAQGGPSGGAGPVAVGPGGSLGSNTQNIPVHWSASVTLGVIGLAVLLAIVGGLLAGALGSWRISQLRPADALARVD
ncbi:MAG: ABC transporter permease [Actinobacteria bacterium]|nr:ABC transporter permease [Actinomycetota bacterium]MBO0836840.1 ABC transporter permease [Actinomycetota bacterium]